MQLYLVKSLKQTINKFYFRFSMFKKLDNDNNKIMVNNQNVLYLKLHITYKQINLNIGFKYWNNYICITIYG